MADQRSIFARSLPQTSWTLVDEAGAGGQAALCRLLETYQPAMLAHLVIHKRWLRHDAEDVVQGFIADKIIARSLLAAANRELGKFRTFLLTSLDRYASDIHSFQTAQKRHPQHGRMVNLEQCAEVTDDTSQATSAFDVAWARRVLAQTLERMREECRASGHERIYAVFESRVLEPLLKGVEPPSYADMVTRLGFASPTQASNAFITAKRMFDRNLHRVVGTYARDDQQIEAEVRDLCEILCRAGA